MNSKKNKSGSLTRVPLTFLSVMAMLLLALGWLGWLLLDQDRKLQQQRDQARIDIAAETLSLALMARINEEFSQLKSQTMPLQELPGVGVRFSKGSMEVIPEKGLLYSPLQKPSEAPHESLFRADRLEFQQGKPAELLSLLEQLASSPDPALQAAAHMRLGRIANRSGNAEQALSEYARLAEFEGQLIEGAPAQWLASYARCRIFLAQGSQDNFLIELSKLSALLASGGSGVAKSTYLFYAGEVNRWVNDTAAIQPKVILPDSHAVSDSVESLYLIRTEQVQGRGRPEGLQIAGQGAESLLMMWYSDDREMLGRVIRIDDLLDSGFFGEIQELQLQGLGWSISDAEGRRILISDMEPVSDVSSVSLAIGDSSISVWVGRGFDLNSDQHIFNITGLKTGSRNCRAAGGFCFCCVT
jgi:hypothetical protein